MLVTVSALLAIRFFSEIKLPGQFVLIGPISIAARSGMNDKKPPMFAPTAENVRGENCHEKPSKQSTGVQKPWPLEASMSWATG